MDHPPQKRAGQARPLRSWLAPTPCNETYTWKSSPRRLGRTTTPRRPACVAESAPKPSRGEQAQKAAFEATPASAVPPALGGSGPAPVRTAPARARAPAAGPQVAGTY